MLKCKIKKITILSVVIVAVCFCLKQAKLKENTVMDLALANIEALSQDEGTAVGKCYKQGDVVGDYAWRYECDSKTSSDMIYPCPKTQSFTGNSVEDRCTK